MNETEVAGLHITFERVGQGSPLVLLHGVLGDSRLWRRQLEELSDEFTVVAWDAPGCGRSSDPPDTFRLPDYADVLVAFIDALGLEPPHLLGLGWAPSSNAFDDPASRTCRPPPTGCRASLGYPAGYATLRHPLSAPGRTEVRTVHCGPRSPPQVAEPGSASSASRGSRVVARQDPAG